MSNRLLWVAPFCFFLLLIVSACGNHEATHPTPTINLLETVNDPQGLSENRESSTEIIPTNEPTSTALATSTPSPTTTPELPCSPEQCTYPGHFFMVRPIPTTANDKVDPTYRYGSTQEGARPTHHGVEFVNEEGTPVLSVAEGTVIVAGDDAQQAYADFPFYYGNLVIIEHHFKGITDPVFSLYGHLSMVQAQVGDQVQAGDQIGAVGYTGIAEWSHLHFEVRVGENLFGKTRNPELWLMPHQNESKELNGALAGRIIDEFGVPIYIPAVVVERLSPEGEFVETIYVETYADFTINGDDAFGENFVIGDLPPGTYMVSFVARGLQVLEVEIYPNRVTLLVFDASQTSSN